jgi:translation initiation factor IF-3
LKVNKQIRALKVRVISASGEQVGVLSIKDALALAEESGLDLVEIASTSTPPVCKVIDYGKYRYDQTKREKESKKAQHQIKVKEVKFKPNIDEHDYDVKFRRAQVFLEKGNKVKATCMFRGREAAHPEIGIRVLERFCKELEDIGIAESGIKRTGRVITVVIAPVGKKK